MPEGNGNLQSNTNHTIKRIALLGNPNSGKTSVFNRLTGLHQKTGNFPGVTVDKKVGTAVLPNQSSITIIDFPGTYSLYPTSLDERVVVQTFSNPSDVNYPDAVLYVADSTQLEKHLLLFTQIQSLGLPMILGLNMSDLLEPSTIDPDLSQLSKDLGVPVVLFSGRTGDGVDLLKEKVQDLTINTRNYIPSPKQTYRFSKEENILIESLAPFFKNKAPYQLLLTAHHHDWLMDVTAAQRINIKQLMDEHDFQPLRFQVQETMRRYDGFLPAVQKMVRQADPSSEKITDRIDRIVTHRIAGPFIFFALMFFIFQAIFTWASYPMDWIDAGFAALGDLVNNTLPETWFRDLLTDGIIAGLGGILIFIPQIAILFFLISILEEVGYMSRAVYLFDNLLRRFGLNGRSIVAFVSGGACAIPAIMSTRTISNWKERLITIMVTPLISCSARIPVYTVLVAFVVPAGVSYGYFNAQGLVFMGLYLLGVVAALLSAWVFHKILKTEEKSYLLLELPIYRPPVARNVWLHTYEKTKTFVIEAGKVIFVISIILWFLASYAPGDQMAVAEQEALSIAQTNQLDQAATDNLIESKKIEVSYAGHLGKLIEPAIRPLGFDWKIGIALITSFAAREVFVGTMATIYSIGSNAEEGSVIDRLSSERDPITGEKVYTQATALSLLVFYVFAMQCMSTLAVVRRETKSWKWTLLQFFYMTALAYFGSLFVYTILS
ncbi:MAG: ferrous iron transport protein B [Saprospiraceae bacterium]